MSSAMKFPAAYYQGKDALYEFERQTACYGDSFLFVGGKSALAAARPKLERSFQSSPAKISFEQTPGIPCVSEATRVKRLAKACGASVLCAVGGGGVMDIVRLAAMELDKTLIMIPTAAASDAPCTFVTVLYSENGEEIVGDRIFHKCPDMVFVDTTVIANAPLRLFVSGMGDALATCYEAETCLKGGAPISVTAMTLCRSCSELILEYGASAYLAAKNHVVTPALERVVEANCFLSGVGGVNAGCAGAHGLGDYLNKLPGGHSFLHGERVAVGLVVQLVLENYPSAEIERIIRFGLAVGLPMSLRDLGISNLTDVAEQIGRATEQDHFIVHLRCDHSAQAIQGAIIAACAMVDELREKELSYGNKN